MIADKFVLGCSKDFIRVIIPQITLEHEREFLHIRKFTDIIRVDFLLFHPVMVKRRETVQAGTPDFLAVYTASSGDLLLAFPRFVDPNTSLNRLSSVNHSLRLSFKPW